MIKYFRFDFHYALWSISYCNLMMLLNTIPVYKFDKDKKAKDEERIEEVNSIHDLIKMNIE